MNNSNIRVSKSDAILNIAQLYLSGINIRLDDWRETLLLDEKPIVVPGNNQFVVLPSEIGLQPPNYFASFPYTGIALYEEYNASNYLATGWNCSLRVPGSLGSALSGAVYVRSLTSPDQKTIIAPFYISGGQYYNSGLISETRVSGDHIIGWDIYTGMNNAEDLSVSLMGRYHDLYEGNISQGVIMSSGDAAISFFLEYGAITGEGILEYYSSNQFVATRWGIYSMTPGSGTLNIDPFIPTVPLTGRFYYRDPKDNIKYTISNFYLPTGSIAEWRTFDDPFYIPFRRIVGIDIYNGLYNLKNLNIVLGGRSISSANYFKNVVTQTIFDYYSGTFESGYFTPFAEGLQNQFDTFSGQITGEYITFSGDVYEAYSGFSGTVINILSSFSGGVTGDYSTFTGYVLNALDNFSGYMTGTLEAFSGYITGNISGFQNQINTFSGQMTGDFYYLSGFLTGLVEAGNSGMTSLNNSYGAVDIDGVSGVEISKDGYPSQIITVKYTSGNFNTIDFATNLDANIPHKEGRLYYSDDTKTFNAYLDIPDVTLNIGQEEYIRIVNKTSQTIFNGTPVYISGAQGSRPKAWPALATDRYHIEHLVGVATHDIIDNNEGLVTTRGILNGINTNSFNAGDILFLGETGDIVNSLPNPATSSYVRIGYVITSQNNGKILVDLGNRHEPSNVTIKDVTGNPYYFTKSDIGKMISFSGNIPTQTGILQTGLGFEPGDYISMMNFGTGELYISSGNGCRIVSRDSAFKAIGQYSVMEAICKSPNFWIVYGDVTNE
jgi:hypothetical protein